jgi:hypothetical protein
MIFIFKSGFAEGADSPSVKYNATVGLIQAYPQYASLSPELSVLDGVVIVIGMVVFVICAWLSLDISSLWGPIISGICSLGLCAIAIYYIIDLDHKRASIKVFAGSGYQDNQWGFGQVLALFIWIPFLINCIRIIMVSRT